MQVKCPKDVMLVCDGLNIQSREFEMFLEAWFAFDNVLINKNTVLIFLLSVSALMSLEKRTV